MNNQSVLKAKQFIEFLHSNEIHRVIGKADVWSENDIPPQNVGNSLNDDSLDALDSIYIKRINNPDSTLAIRKIVWESKVFTQYDPFDNALMSKDFYCVNTDGIVYVCISNSSNAVSEIEPTATTTEPFTLADGYVWKLVAQTPAEIELKFDVPGYFPIKHATSSDVGYSYQHAAQIAAVGGAIERVDIIHPGKKYSDQVFVEVIGDGHGAKFELDRHLITGEIQKVNAISRGSGYTFAIVNVVDPIAVPGTGAILAATIAPLNGLGANPLTELGANTVLVCDSLLGNDGGLLDLDFTFRKTLLVSGINTYPTSILDISQVSESRIYVNPLGSKTIAFKSNHSLAHKLSLLLENGTIVFVVKNEANPYGTELNETNCALNDIEMYFINGEWRVKFSSLTEGTFKMWYKLATSGDVNIAGDVSHQNPDSLIEYNVHHDNSIPLDSVSEFRATTFNDVKQVNLTVVSISDQSGMFEAGEEVTFINGGSAIIVQVPVLNEMKLTSVKGIEQGTVIGKSSGATANIVSFQRSPVVSFDNIFYRLYTEGIEKMKDENLSFVSIFNF